MAENHPDHRPWPVLNTRILFDHPRIVLAEDRVQLPNGDETDWLYQVGGQDFVTVICLNAEQRVLVAYQYCHPVRAVVAEFPGGGMEADESFEEAAQRELMEEVGYYPTRLDHLGAYLPNNRRRHIRGHVLVATELVERSLPGDPEEFITFEWLVMAEIDERIRNGRYDNGTLLAAWTLFKLHWPALKVTLGQG